MSWSATVAVLLALSLGAVAAFGVRYGTLDPCTALVARSLEETPSAPPSAGLLIRAWLAAHGVDSPAACLDMLWRRPDGAPGTPEPSG